MTMKISRIRLLGSAAIGLGLTMAGALPARADSICSPVLTAPNINRANCTSPNGDGRSEGIFNSGATLTIGSVAAVVDYSGDYSSGLTTGYIESTTLGRGVIRFTSTRPFTYVGTGSTLFGSSAATGASILDITAPSVTLNSGTLTALGSGSTALAVTANGGAGSGGIDATIDGNVRSAAGTAILLSSTDAAATGNVVLRSNAGSTISSGAGDAVRIRTNGFGAITVNLAGPVTATGGNGIFIGDAGVPRFFDSRFCCVVPPGAGGDISLTTGAVTASGSEHSAIFVNSSSVTANLTIVTNGVLQADRGIVGTLITPTATGNVDITSNGAINAGRFGISAFTAGTGSVIVRSIGSISNPSGFGISAGTLGGSVTVTAGAVSSSGFIAILARQTNVAGSGSVSVNTSGPISGLVGGINALNFGFGNITVATSGLVTATGGPAIIADNGLSASAGNIAVTVGAGGTSSLGIGVAATLGGSGSVNVAVNGVVRTFAAAGVLGAATSGAISVSNSAGIFAVGGAGIQTSSTTGNQLINIGAAVSGSGAGFDGVNASSTSGSLTVNVDGGNVNGGDEAIFVSGGGAKVINVSAGRTVSGNYGIGSQGTGATTINNAGVINGTTSAILANNNSVTLNNASGATLGGAVSLGGLNDTFNNSGVLNFSGNSNFGAGTDAINNLAGGVINLAAGATIAGLETLANAGTISLQNGAAGDVLTLAGNYSGTGAARLLLDVSATGADRIVIGGAASGSTSISLNRIGGAPSINTSGLLLIDAGSATAGAFTLIGNGFSTGLVSVTLEQRSAGFFLVARPDVAAIEPVVVGDLAQNLWYQSADIYSNYIALRRSDLGGNRSNGLGVWGQVYYSQDRTDRQDVSVFGNNFRVDRIKTKRRGAQAGVDYLLGSNALVGITGGYERAEADIRNSASDFRASGYNIGGYAMFGGGNGFYADALVKYDRAKLRFDNPLFDSMIGNPRLKSFGAQGQVGYRFGTEATTFDLGAGIAFVRSRIDNFSVGTIAFDFDRVKSTRGHLGARATFGGGAFSPFVDAKVYHEFDGDTRLGLLSGAASDRIASRGRGTWGRVEAGIGAQNGSGPILAAWGDFGDVRGFGAKAGWRFGGAREAIALTPPPPPPMAPATQTCADGSVMLATDICPSPPPPPPPPAPEAVPERG